MTASSLPFRNTDAYTPVDVHTPHQPPPESIDMAKAKSQPVSKQPTHPPKGVAKSFRLHPDKLRMLEELCERLCINQTAAVEMCIQRVHRVEMGLEKKW